MIHLITVVGNSAKNFYIEQQRTSNFKSLMRSVTSGRVMIISTKFRSDLFYNAQESRSKAILKLWKLYTNKDRCDIDQNDLFTAKGDEKSLSRYFDSIDKLSANWYLYRLYKKVFSYTFNNDPQNPVAQKIMQCDQYLIDHLYAKRTPLVSSCQKVDSSCNGDTFSLAMRTINSDIISN